MSTEILPIVGALTAACALASSIVLAFKTNKKTEEVLNDLIIERNSVSHHNLEKNVANEAIFRLSSHLQKLKPDYIVGVNRGGTMIGAFVSLGLGIKSKNFIRCLVSRKGKYKATCGAKHLSGTVVVLDDISRSGRTLQAAVDEIARKNPNINTIYSAVLITTLNDKNIPMFKELDYFSFATQDNNMYLPWTPKLSKDSESERLKYFRAVRKKPIEKIAYEVSNTLYSTGNTH